MNKIWKKTIRKELKIQTVLHVTEQQVGGASPATYRKYSNKGNIMGSKS